MDDSLNELPQLTMFLDHRITFEMANARYFLFYDFTHQQWLCCG